MKQAAWKSLMMKHVMIHIMLAALAGVMNAKAASCTWTGAWDNTPSSADDVIIIRSGMNLSWSASLPATVASWTQENTYTNTVTVETVYGASGFTNFTISGDCVISNGTWAHQDNSTTESKRLKIEVGANLTIETGGVIKVTGLGYDWGQGPGKPTTGTSLWICGAAHGGQGGGNGLTGSGGLVTYGLITTPTRLGSGGGFGYSGATSGGGAVILNVSDTLTVNGRIEANGGDATASSRGAGAGGSIHVTTGNLQGNGVIEATGGSATGGSGGGGGRIAVILTIGTNLDSVITCAYAGSGVVEAGAAGTVYLKKSTDTYGKLIVDNNNISTPELTTTLIRNNTNQLDLVVVTNAAKCELGTGGVFDLSDGGDLVGSTNSMLIFSEGEFRPGSTYTLSDFTFSQRGTNNTTFYTNLVISTGGVLMHVDNSSTEANKINMTIMGNLTIETGGVIKVTGLGYDRGQGPGKPTCVNPWLCGAAHGGQGGNSQGVPGGDVTYGSITTPTRLGSGGGSSVHSGSTSGGGAVILNVSDMLTVNGRIEANGGDATVNSRSAGAGGSIHVTTGNLQGNGVIEATGGSATGGGAGGGGRISVILTVGINLDSVITCAYAGNGAIEDGAAGTIYIKKSTDTYGTLRIDNTNRVTTVATLISSNVTDTTVGDVNIRDGAIFGVGTEQSITVHGNWTNGGSLTADTGSTVTLAGTDTAAIYGDNTFYHLTCSTAGKRLDFEAGTTSLVSGTLTLTGAPGNLIDLNATSQGNYWYLTLAPPALQSISYVAVEDCNADAGNTVGATDSSNVNHNVNWLFGVQGTNRWTGSVSTDWGASSNWDQGHVPFYQDVEVRITDVINAPILDADREIGLHLAIESGASLALNGHALTVNGAADIDGVIIAGSTETITFKGNLDLSNGTFTHANSTVVISGTDAQSIMTGSNSFYDMVVNTPSNTVAFKDTFSAHDITVSDNGGPVTFEAVFAVHNLAVNNTTNTVTFQAGFEAHEFRCRASSGSLNFHEGSDYNITNLLLRGEADNLIILRSSSTGQQWKLNVSGWHAVRYVDVKDSNAFSGHTIYAANSINSLNNTNWHFGTWLVWDGSESTDFAASNNWTQALAPCATNLLLIDGNGANAPIISSSTTVARMIVSMTETSVLTVNTNLTITGDLTILSGGTLTHGDNSTDETHKLNLSVEDDLLIEFGGSIDVNGKGFNVGEGPGAGRDQWDGGSHGGQGGDDGSDGIGETYGSITMPTRQGSGACSGSSGSGGGVIILDVGGILKVNGTMSADGDNSTFGGAAAGGSIYATAGRLAGDGTLSANGGNRGNAWGGGGGGRIALILTDGTEFGDITVTACGGSGVTYGAAGTIYLKIKDGDSSVVVDNNAFNTSARTILPPDIDGVASELHDTSLIVTNYGKIALSTNAWVGDILIYTNSSMTLTNFYLHVDSLEHNLEDLTDKNPGATNRVDYYEQILWEGLPAGTVFIFW